MSKIVTARAAVSFLAFTIWFVGPVAAQCPDPSGLVNYELTSKRQPNLAQIRFTPAVSATVAARLADPVNPLIVVHRHDDRDHGRTRAIHPRPSISGGIRGQL